MTVKSHGALASQPIDLDHLARYTLGEITLNCEILNLFAQQSQACFLRLKDTADEGSWREAAHSLKGAAVGVGAMRVARAAENAFLCHGRRFATDRLDILAELAAAVAEARVFIESYIPQADASESA
jgi:hypothetical protein